MVEKMELLVGDVRGKVAILIDDMIDTGHTVKLAAQVLKDAGAKEVYALISHGESTSYHGRAALTEVRLVVRDHHGELEGLARGEARGASAAGDWIQV